MLRIVKEKSTYGTSKYLKGLQESMGFPIGMIQADNGLEFVHDEDKTDKASAFKLTAKEPGLEILKTRPYSPWQNGKVERSHREYGKILYARKSFTGEKELLQQVDKHERRHSSTVKTSLNFKTPNQRASDYFSLFDKPPFMQYS